MSCCCSVATCKNYAGKTKKFGMNVVYHCFPKDPLICKKWIIKCKRAEKINTKCSRVCSDHFSLSDYEDDMENRLLGLPIRRRLKATAVPSLNLPNEKVEHETSRRRAKRNNARCIRSAALKSLTLAAAAADPQSESYSPQSSETLSVVKSIIASAKPSKSRKPVKAAPLKPVELTRLESSESILPDLCVPAWSDKPTGKTYLKQNLSSATSSNASTSTSTIDTVNSEATFLSTFKVEPEDDSIAELFDDSVMDTPPESLWEFHPALRSLSWLIGCWRSITGFASYPTMETVPYREEMQFFGTMQPVLQYKSETWHSETQKLMHCESGFLRIDPGSKMVAFMVAHNFGVAELSEGTLGDQPMLMLKSKSISRMSFTKNASVTEIVRSFELKGNVLTSEVSMATVTQPLQKHLVVKYAKVL